MSSEVIHEVSEQRSRNMSAIKSKNTKPEIKVRKVDEYCSYLRKIGDEGGWIIK